MVEIPPDRPVLRYHGGKWRLAPWIISHFPPHRTYVEPFAGAASVLMRKPRSYAEVYNDRWGTVVDVFRVMRDRELSADLERRLRYTPFSRDEFMQSYIEDPDDIVERARKSIIRSFMGFGSASTNGDHPTGFRSNSNRSGTTPAHDWQHYPDQINSFCSRLQGVVIENREAADVIAQHDGPGTLIYCDPPYPHSTRNMRRGNAAYAVEMSDDDHEQLAAVLRNCVGMVIVSSYHSPLYERLYAGWETSELEALADGAQPRREVLWFNQACAQKQQQKRLFA